MLTTLLNRKALPVDPVNLVDISSSRLVKNVWHRMQLNMRYPPRWNKCWRPIPTWASVIWSESGHEMYARRHAGQSYMQIPGISGISGIRQLDFYFDLFIGSKRKGVARHSPIRHSPIRHSPTSYSTFANRHFAARHTHTVNRQMPIQTFTHFGLYRCRPIQTSTNFRSQMSDLRDICIYWLRFIYIWRVNWFCHIFI